MLLLLPLMLLLLRSVVASEVPIDEGVFKQVLDLALESLGVQEIQVCTEFV